MEKKFVCISSEKLEFGGYNTNLVSQSDDCIAGLSYWVKTTRQLKWEKPAVDAVPATDTTPMVEAVPAQKADVITLNMDLYDITMEESKDKHPIRVIRPKM